jgi:outer membrane protein assembly factor BamB
MDYIDNTEIKLRPTYQGLMGGAVVAAVFAALAAMLVAVNSYQIRNIEPRQAGQLREMEKQFDARANDVALAGQIRELDARIRRDALRRQQFAHAGTMYLVGSLIVSAGCFLAGRMMLRPSPVVSTQPACTGMQVHQAMQVRMAVTVVLAVVASAGLYAVLRASAGSKPKASAAVADWAEAVKGQWPSFRGLWGNGVAEQKEIPTAWSEKENKGILWKSAVPLASHSSPVVWGDKIFLSGATKEGQKIFCYSAKDGKLLWTGEVKPAGTDGREMPEVMEDTGYAASTPVVNGGYVCAIFTTGDIGCFDMDGKIQWQTALGIPESTYGYAASLAVFNDKVIVQFDQGTEVGKSELIAMAMADGKVAWRTKRPVPNSWTSPTVVKVGNAYQILTCGSPWVIGYEAATGRELWRASCLGSDVAPTQILAGGLVLAIQPYDKLYAIRIDNAGGDVTQTAMAWQTQGDMPDICSPVSDGKWVWTLASDGRWSCFDVAAGTLVYKQSLEGEYLASPSLVGDTLYVLKRNGQMILLQAGREYKEIGRGTVDEECHAFGDGRIYLRSTKSLYCIGQLQ